MQISSRGEYRQTPLRQTAKQKGGIEMKSRQELREEADRETEVEVYSRIKQSMKARYGRNYDKIQVKFSEIHHPSCYIDWIQRHKTELEQAGFEVEKGYGEYVNSYTRFTRKPKDIRRYPYISIIYSD